MSLEDVGYYGSPQIFFNFLKLTVNAREFSLPYSFAMGKGAG